MTPTMGNLAPQLPLPPLIGASSPAGLLLVRDGQEVRFWLVLSVLQNFYGINASSQSLNPHLRDLHFLGLIGVKKVAYNRSRIEPLGSPLPLHSLPQLGFVCQV